MKEREVYIVGHKNPDTDSICSSIAYANLRNQIENTNKYVPMRAGNTNPETKYVLAMFGVKKPEYLATLYQKISDVDMRKTSGVEVSTSLKVTWAKMKAEDLRTMPVFENGELVGLITQGDIARSMMEEHDSASLSSSCVSCKNIVETLDGQLIVGDMDKVFDKGTIQIGAANPEVMTKHIKEHSMVICGNRADAQISALEQKADWLVVCLGAEVFDQIKRLAKELGCNIIVTPHSTYKVARLINQAMPVNHVMYKGDIKSFHEGDYVKNVKNEMTKYRLRYFPILDKNDKFVGFISQRNLLEVDKKKVIMVDHNEFSQAVDGIEEAEILQIVDHHRIGGITTPSPVYFRNQPVGCTSTIVAQMYEENGIEINKTMASLMCSAILSDTLCFRSPTCTPIDKLMAEKLGKIAGIDLEEHAANMFRAGSEISNKNEEEIFYQDFKVFSIEGREIGVGQVTVLGEEAINNMSNRMLPFMQEFISRTRLDIVILMMTDIIEECSTILYISKDKNLDMQSVVEDGFGVKAQETSALLHGVVSRKKQLIPSITIGMKNK